MARRLSAMFMGAPLDDQHAAESSPHPSRSRSPVGKLFKQLPASVHDRKLSGQHLTPFHDSVTPSLQELRQADPVTNGGDLALLPPPGLGSGYHSRSNSLDPSVPGTSRSRSMTPTLRLPDQSPVLAPLSAADTDDTRSKKKHWWNRAKDKDESDRGPHAWIAGHPERLSYDAEGLMAARPMQELWDNQDGNCYVYLFSRNSGKGASFKVNSAVFASSPVLTKLAFGDLYSHDAVPSGDRRSVPLDRHFVDAPATPPLSPTRKTDSTSSGSSRHSRDRPSRLSDAPETHLYLPIKLSSETAALQTDASPTTPKGDERAGAMEDLQTLLDYRNFFAFLCGQSLIATERRSSFFGIFMAISGILKSFKFANADASTYGEVAASSFDHYVEELGLADVRSSREKTIESIVLGERMKSVLLYNEAFTHGVGKHEDLLALKSPKLAMISPITQNRLTRAAMDLDKRVASIRLIMTDFDFPFLFSGIMSSKTSVERKEGVRFDQWKEHFLGMRKFVMGLYKQRYGDWPPKAGSKKNSLETSGLNRLVLRDVYLDLSSLYDMLVDRTNLTTRSIDGSSPTSALDSARDPPAIRGLRAVLSEYDRSSPPVKPPVPFDLPRLPAPAFSRTGDAKRDAKLAHKKLTDDEVLAALRASHNLDARPSSATNLSASDTAIPFVSAFREMERRAARGCSAQELEDLRIGQWLFVYAVLQALPMLACDAPAIRSTRGVEYFLCAPPRSGVPWADASAQSRTWYSVGGGAASAVVSLPADVVSLGVEGIYRRSHCWVVAERWASADPALSDALHRTNSTSSSLSVYPPETARASPRPHFLNTEESAKRYSSLTLGLEALPLPSNIHPDLDSRSPRLSPAPRSRSLAASPAPRSAANEVDASKTFDSILQDVEFERAQKAGKKKR